MPINPPFHCEHIRCDDLRRRQIEADPKINEATFLSMGSLHDAIVAAVRSALEDDDAASRLRGKLDAMEVALRCIESWGQRKRDLALAAMAEAGLVRLDAPGVNIAVRHTPPLLIVTDEDLVPEAFRVERPALLDYQRIRDALENGADVPGARLADPEPYLSVRTS